MPEITLRPLTEDEFDAYLTDHIEDYARARFSAGAEATYDEALAVSVKQHTQLLSDGLRTPGMLLMRAESGGRPVGLLFLALPQASPDGTTGWIYDIRVDVDRRGEGFGRALLAAAEQQMLDRGVDTMALNVFADNTVAKTLYTSAGYEVTTDYGTAAHMLKHLR